MKFSTEWTTFKVRSPFLGSQHWNKSWVVPVEIELCDPQEIITGNIVYDSQYGLWDWADAKTENEFDVNNERHVYCSVRWRYVNQEML